MTAMACAPSALFGERYADLRQAFIAGERGALDVLLDRAEQDGMHRETAMRYAIVDAGTLRALTPNEVARGFGWWPILSLKVAVAWPVRLCFRRAGSVQTASTFACTNKLGLARYTLWADDMGPHPRGASEWEHLAWIGERWISEFRVRALEGRL